MLTMGSQIPLKNQLQGHKPGCHSPTLLFFPSLSLSISTSIGLLKIFNALDNEELSRIKTYIKWAKHKQEFLHVLKCFSTFYILKVSRPDWEDQIPTCLARTLIKFSILSLRLKLLQRNDGKNHHLHFILYIQKKLNPPKRGYTEDFVSISSSLQRLELIQA